MDEIDKVVDNLFGPHITKNKDVAAVPSELPPSAGPELDTIDIIQNNSHPDIVQNQTSPHPDIIQKQTGPHPDIVGKPAAPQPEPKVAAKAAVKIKKPVVVKKSEEKTAIAKVSASVDIVEIKKQTAKMLRHLHKAINSKNWWHKLYYANKFLHIAGNISKTVTKREK